MPRGKYGWQPAKVELFKRRLTIQQVAEEIGVPERHLRNALAGKTYPMPEVRKGLPRLLDVPLGDLFCAEMLEASYDPRKASAVRS
ncbi:helix-turn-helix transcriptional regulator [Micromonospora sp. NPDC050200]|uniref:helix-turn-helix transcriptional regulator n=1 Tax=Micromonospora sp. NPDC050200 TaxID=3155664 RepID=UPI0033E5EC24